MPGTYTKPKSYNRRFFINIGTSLVPEWAEISQGIASRGNSFTENEEEFYYMADRGTAEKEPTTQNISRTFSGNRFIGDKAQDEIFINRIYDLDNRSVEFMEFYDNVKDGPNGYKGNASITISDDGSGDASSRETISFGLSINGKPKRGTVTLDDDGVPEFTESVSTTMAKARTSRFVSTEG